MLTTEEKILAVVAALEEIKAANITVIDTSKLSNLFDRMIIASANSTRQTKALADNVVVKLKERVKSCWSRRRRQRRMDFGRFGRSAGTHHAARDSRVLQPRRIVEQSANRSPKIGGIA